MFSSSSFHPSRHSPLEDQQQLQQQLLALHPPVQPHSTSATASNPNPHTNHSMHHSLRRYSFLAGLFLGLLLQLSTLGLDFVWVVESRSQHHRQQPSLWVALACSVMANGVLLVPLYCLRHVLVLALGTGTSTATTTTTTNAATLSTDLEVPQHNNVEDDPPYVGWSSVGRTRDDSMLPRDYATRVQSSSSGSNIVVMIESSLILGVLLGVCAAWVVTDLALRMKWHALWSGLPAIVILVGYRYCMPLHSDSDPFDNKNNNNCYHNNSLDKNNNESTDAFLRNGAGSPCSVIHLASNHHDDLYYNYNLKMNMAKMHNWNDEQPLHPHSSSPVVLRATAAAALVNHQHHHAVNDTSTTMVV